MAKVQNDERYKVTKVEPISTEEFPSAANGLIYSVLDNSKIKRTININTLSWEVQCMFEGYRVEP